MSFLEEMETCGIFQFQFFQWFFSNFSTKPHFLYEGAIFLRKFNIKNYRLSPKICKFKVIIKYDLQWIQSLTDAKL